jgi:PAS domain S-box-containing protein
MAAKKKKVPEKKDAGTARPTRSLRDGADEALRESERKFREIFNKINDGIHLHEIGEDGRPGKFIDVNDVACEMLQYSKDEMLQYTPLDFATEYHSRPLERLVEELKTSGHAVFETGHRRKDGTIVPVEINAHVITLQGKKVMLSVVRDITERKLAEKALRESEERLNLAIDGANLGLWDLNIVTSEVVHNRRWAEMLGFSIDEMEKPADWWAQHVHPDDLSHVQKSSEDHYAGNIPFFDGVCRIRHKDGIWRWVHSQGKMVLRDIDGRPLRMIGINQDITEQKRAEEALGESKEFLNKIINSISDPIHVKDRQHRVILINDAACRLFNLSREEIIGKTAYELFPSKEMADISWQEDEEVFRTGEGSVNEETNTYAPRKTLFVLVKKTLYTDTAGNQFLVGITTDITDRKQAMLELVSAQERLKEAHRLAHIGTWDWVIEIDTVIWSEELCNIVGWDSSRPAPSYAELPRFYTPASWDRLSSAVTRALTTGEPYNLELEIIRLDGSIRWINAFGGVKRDTNGKIIGLHGTVQDITDRKQAEDALRESESRYRTLAESAPESIFILSRDGRFTYINNQGAAILGKTIEEITELSLGDVFPQPVVAHMMDAITRMFADGKPIREETLVPSSAGLSSQDSFLVPLKTPDGTVTSILGISRDITDLKKAEELLKHFNEELEEKVKSRTEELNASLDEKVILLREVHHRVKNNLQILISLLNLQSRTITDPQVIAALKESTQRIRAMSMVHEKLYTGSDLAHIEFINYLSSLANSQVSFYQFSPGKVKLEINGGNIMLDINTAIPLGLVMNELISNALKHAFPGDRKGIIRINAHEMEDRLEITLVDDGIGVPEGFDAKTSPTLGLRLVNILVEQLSGTITLDRTAGTAYHISIPKKEQ